MQRILPFFFLCFLRAAAFAGAAEPQKPNILLFYADDLGYGELGCYGFQEVPTPHIDSIAAMASASPAVTYRRRCARRRERG